MKTQIRFLTVAATAFAASIASAKSLYDLGDGVTLHFIGEASVVYEDNIYLKTTESADDLRVEFVAGLELRSSPDASAETTFSITNRSIRYDTEPLDDNFLSVRFNTRYNSGVVMSNGYASYVEDYSSRFDLDDGGDVFGAVVHRDRTSVGGSLKYGVSNLTSVKAGFDYADLDYTNTSLTNYQGNSSYSIPVTVFYQIRPTIDLTTGVRYRRTDTDLGIEYTDMYYYVGAVGELFSPVVHADLSVGYQKRNAKGNLADSDSPSYKLSLIYTGDPKSSIYATIQRDFRTSATSSVSSYTYTSGTIGASYSLTRSIGLNAALVYAETEYQESDRSDDIEMVRLGATYSPNDYLTVAASFNRRDIDINSIGGSSNYKTNEFRVSASLRY